MCRPFRILSILPCRIRWSLSIFSGFSLQLLKLLRNCEDHFHLYPVEHCRFFYKVAVQTWMPQLVCLLVKHTVSLPGVSSTEYTHKKDLYSFRFCSAPILTAPRSNCRLRVWPHLRWTCTTWTGRKNLIWTMFLWKLKNWQVQRDELHWRIPLDLAEPILACVLVRPCSDVFPLPSSIINSSTRVDTGAFLWPGHLIAKLDHKPLYEIRHWDIWYGQ